jgi:hypothetical protein
MSTTILYKELFQNKIVNNAINLIIDYKNYFDVFSIIDEIKKLNLELHFLHIDSKNIYKLNMELEKYNYKKIFFYSESISNFKTSKKFNNIIFFELFSAFSDEIINNNINNSKSLLKNEYSNIIFINTVITKYFNYMYHPISYINYLFKNNVYIEDMFDKIRQNNLYLVDSHRINTVEILFYPFEYFSVICRFR